MMKDYVTYEFTGIIDFQDDLLQMTEHFELPVHNRTFCVNAEIRYNCRKPAFTEIVLFSKPESRLFEILQYLKLSGKNILAYLQIYHTPNSGDKTGILDFSKSTPVALYKDEEEQKAGKAPVIISMPYLTYYISAPVSGISVFHLTENACLPLDAYSVYCRDNSIAFSDNPVSNGTPDDFFTWGGMAFGLRFSHMLQEKNKHDIHIVRLPQLVIKAGSGKTPEEIIRYAGLMCLLMSLYWGKFIDYYIGYIRTGSQKAGPELNERIEFRYVEDQADDCPHFPFGNTYPTFFDFIDAIDYDKVMCSRKLLEDITDRVIRSRYIDPTSEFMLLYNVIEKIRKAREAGQPLVVEEYSFTLSKTATDKFIKHKLDEIAGIVQEQDRTAYLAKTFEKVSVIRKTGLIDQFDSLIIYAGLEPDRYEINFTQLIKIRNRIYHGNFTETDLRPYIRAMRRLTGDLLLKTFSKSPDASICTLSR